MDENEADENPSSLETSVPESKPRTKPTATSENGKALPGNAVNVLAGFDPSAIRLKQVRSVEIFK
jgi:hypothetical protein